MDLQIGMRCLQPCNKVKKKNKKKNKNNKNLIKILKKKLSRFTIAQYYNFSRAITGNKQPHMQY